MNDWSDWAENRAPPASSRWRWVPRVAVVLALLAAVAYLAYVVAELGDRAMRVADDFIAHTTHSTTSPDGHWSLLIDSVNTGALGGSTRVNLRPVTADDDAQGVTLFDGNWLRDSAVRWRDARTVSIDGWLSAPFVEHAVETGSPATSGAETDAAGYVHNTLVPDERVVMLSGLSLVLPGNLSGELLTRRGEAAGRPWQRLVPDRRVSWTVLSLKSLHAPELVRLQEGARLIGGTKDRRIAAYWKPHAGSVFLVTDRPGALVGLVSAQHASATNPQEARHAVEQLCRRLSLKRLKLPW